MINKSIKDVYLRKSEMTFDNEVNVLQMDGMELAQQNYNAIVGVQVVEVFQKDNLEKPYMFKCFYRVRTGVRLVKDAGKETQRVYFEIVAEHDAVYESDDDVTQDILEEFSASDEISNSIWPYWKEHVASLCSKAGLSVLATPPPKRTRPLKLNGSRKSEN